MSQTFHQFISERGFDRFRSGLEARFTAHGLSYRIVYSESAPVPSLLVRLENQERLGEVCVWETGRCELTASSVADGQFKDEHFVLPSADGFHEHLAAIFRYVAKRDLSPAA